MAPSFPLPRTVPEFVKDVNFSLLSQILNGSLGSNSSEFYQRYLTFIEYSRSHDITFGQVEEIFRIFLRHDMLSFWLDQDAEMSTLEKLRGLLTIFFKGPTISDRLRQIKEFERGQSESLESAILRLTLLLDKTEMLSPVNKERHDAKSLSLTLSLGSHIRLFGQRSSDSRGKFLCPEGFSLANNFSKSAPKWRF